MLEIKSIYGEWRGVDKETAKKYIKSIEKGMLCNEKERIKYINEKRLRGVSYEELFKDD